MYVMNGIGQQEQYCPADNTCFAAVDEMDSATSMCQYGYKPQRLPGPCPTSKVLDSRTLWFYDPCSIAPSKLCTSKEAPGTQAADIFDAAAAEDEAALEKEASATDNTMLYVIGGVAAVVVGTAAYFFAKKR